MKDFSNLDQNYRGVFDGRLGFGRSPAIIVVDFIRAYTTPGAPLYAPAVVEAVKATAPLLVAGRRKGIPVIYTRVLYHPSGCDGGLFVRKVPVLRGMVEGEPLADIVPELPVLRERLIELNSPDIDAIVQVGTNLSMVHLAAAAEMWLGKPVIAINTATYWHALRQNKIKRQDSGAGPPVGGVLRRSR